MVRAEKTSFTLIELLIVIIIIGILATLAIPQYQNLVFKARSAEAKQALSSMADSVWRYYTEAGRYPTSLDQLDVSLPAGAKYYTYSISTGANPPTCRITATDKVEQEATHDYSRYWIEFEGNQTPDPSWQFTKMDGTTYKLYHYYDAATDLDYSTWEGH